MCEFWVNLQFPLRDHREFDSFVSGHVVEGFDGNSSWLKRVCDKLLNHVLVIGVGETWSQLPLSCCRQARVALHVTGCRPKHT